jgi:hypothetical protein
MTLEVARLLGKEDTNKASEEDQLLLRILVPLAKLYTAKQVVCAQSLAIIDGQFRVRYNALHRQCLLCQRGWKVLVDKDI